MKIFPILGNMSSNAFFIVDDKNLLIDSGAGIDDKLRRIVEKIGKVDMIVNTHAHYDHCGGNKYFECKVHIHRDDAKELICGRFYDTYKLFGDELPLKFHKLVEEGDKIILGETVVEVLHTPGHTYGSICLYIEDEGIIFTGDTIFSDGNIGRTDLGGNLKMMINSIDKLSKLRLNAMFPGHGSITDDKYQIEQALKNARELLYG